MKILIKYATRGRPELFKRSLKNIQDTIGNVNYIIGISADIDDETMYNTEIKDMLWDNMSAVIFYGSSKSKIEAINTDMAALGKFNWDILINFSDDMLFTQNNWGLNIIELAKKSRPNDTDFFLHLNDGFVNEKLPTMSIIGRDYYNRDGYIYHPSYKSVSCDAEAMFVAMMRGRHYYYDITLFNHLHPANLPVQVVNDATYHKNDAISHEDTENYFQRREKLFFIENPVVIPYNPNVRE
ncbi:MAG: hypothetical protein V4547_17970 [Bacteroidota bacterium]